MIDVKTLRIGSHVEYDGRMAKIVSLAPYSYCDCVVLSTDEFGIPSRYVIHDGLKDLQPIHITPKLLEELGFEYRDNTYWERWYLGSLTIEKKEYSSYFDYDGNIRLKYLHELENLFYMIYNEELTTE